MNCKDHQGNIVNIGDIVAFCRADTTYIGKVIKISDNLNPQIEYTFINHNGLKVTYKYTPVHRNRYVGINNEDT